MRNGINTCECGAEPKLGGVFVDWVPVEMFVICTECGKQTEKYSEPQIAIEAWNRRTK